MTHGFDPRVEQLLGRGQRPQCGEAVGMEGG